MMKCFKIKYRLLVYLTSFTVCSGDINKKIKIKKSSEFFFFYPLNPKSDKQNLYIN